MKYFEKKSVVAPIPTQTNKAKNIIHIRKHAKFGLKNPLFPVLMPFTSPYAILVVWYKFLY